MVSNAFKPEDEMLDPSVVWVPKVFSMQNFVYAAQAMKYWPSFLTSLQVDIVSALIQVLTCAFIAYGFARFKFWENRFLFALVMLTIIVPPQAIIVPLFMNFRHLDFLGLFGLIGQLIGVDIRPNLLDTPFTFYLPSLFGIGLRSGLFIFIYRQFFLGLPKELEEAAWIDGAGPFKTFFRIVMPSCGVVILTVLIFSIVWHWNDYYLSAMYFTNHFPLAVQLAQIQSNLSSVSGFSKGSAASMRGVLMAGCLIFVLPILLMYLFLQKYFIQSIERVGIVG